MKIGRRILCLILACLMLAAPVFAAGEAGRAGKRYNLIFVTDESGSMKYTDAKKLRYDAALNCLFSIALQIMQKICNLLQVDAAYGQLAQRLPAKRRLFEKLLQHTRYHIKCLRGMGYLTSGVRPARLPLKPRQETTAGLLRTCYLHSLKAAEGYAQQQDNPDY